MQQAVCWYLLLFLLYHEKEYCRGITSNRSQANRRIKSTQSCQACVAGEAVRLAKGSAYKCKPRTPQILPISRKLICLGDTVYNLQKQHFAQYGWTTGLLWGISRHVFFLLPLISLIYATTTLNDTLFGLPHRQLRSLSCFQYALVLARSPVALHEQFVYLIPGGQNCRLQGSFTGLSVTESTRKSCNFSSCFLFPRIAYTKRWLNHMLLYSSIWSKLLIFNVDIMDFSWSICEPKLVMLVFNASLS